MPSICHQFAHAKDIHSVKALYLQLCRLRHARPAFASHGNCFFITRKAWTKLRRFFVSHCEDTVHYTVNGAADVDMQSSDDIIYEQDILRDTASVKPWLIYVDYKHQHGTLLEQAFVRLNVYQGSVTGLTYHVGIGKSL